MPAGADLVVWDRRDPITADVDLAADPEAYGPMKVACEQAVRDLAAWIVTAAEERTGGDYDGMCAHDPEPSYAAGLVVRPLAETARDTLAWLRATPDAIVTGMPGERDAEVLAAWRASAG